MRSHRMQWKAWRWQRSEGCPAAPRERSLCPPWEHCEWGFEKSLGVEQRCPKLWLWRTHWKETYFGAGSSRGCACIGKGLSEHHVRRWLPGSSWFVPCPIGLWSSKQVFLRPLPYGVLMQRFCFHSFDGTFKFRLWTGGSVMKPSKSPWPGLSVLKGKVDFTMETHLCFEPP